MRKRLLVHGLSHVKGGIEQFIFNLVKTLSVEKFSIDLLYFGETFPYENELAGYEYRVIHATGRRDRPFSYAKRIRNLLQQGNYDIVWSNIFSLSDLTIIHEAKKLGIPMRILYTHAAADSGSRFTRIMSHLNRNKLNDATHFWSCSKASAEYFFADRTLHTPYRVFPNAVFPEVYSYDAQARQKLKSEYDLKDAVILGSVGRLFEVKNQRFVISCLPEIIRQYPQVKYMILGEGELHDELIALGKELGLEHHLILPGSKQNANEHYSLFDIYLMPSLSEAMPFSLVEAQMNGLSCIVSTGISQEAALSSKVTFLPLEEELWIQAILEQLASNNYRERSVDFPVEESEFNIHVLGSTFEELIFEALR